MRPREAGACVLWLALLLGSWEGCTQPNASHCGNQSGDATCAARNEATPFCNRCVAANDGCVADPVTAAGCGESSPSTLGATAEASDTSTATSDSCGNGVIDPDEVCDGDAIPQDADCTTEGHGPGPPGCADDCSALDYSQCPPFVGCGDGVVGEGEECDGTNLAQHECSEFEGLSGPGLACTDQCTLDPSGCTPCALSGASCVPQQLACCEANETCEGLLSMERCCVNHPCLGS